MKTWEWPDDDLYPLTFIHVVRKMGFQLRIGQLFLDSASGVVRPVLAISRSFSHAGTYMYYSPSVPPSLHFKLSRQLFLCSPSAGATNSPVNCTCLRVWPRETNTLQPKYLCSQPLQCGLVSNISAVIHSDNVMNSSVNGKVIILYSKSLLKHSIHFQFHRGLMSDSLPVCRSDDKDARHDQTRSAPMDIEELVQFLRDENASDICVIRVPPHLDYVDYFVVCSGFGGRHLRRMADGLVAEMKSVRVGRNNRKIRVEGEDCEDWMCVEMGTTVVHFMTEEARSKYELEKLWALGPVYDDQYRSMEHTIENNP